LAGRRKEQKHGRKRGHELADKIERKKKSLRDENRRLDIKREINFGVSALIDRYWGSMASERNLGIGRKACWRESGARWGRCS
jgi:hypothetical protein